MYSGLLLKLNIVLFSAAAIGYLARYRFPRIALLTCALLVAGASLWLMASTYELAMQGKALTITRDYAEFLRSQNTGAFTTSVWLHAVLAALLFGAGLSGIIAAFVKKELRFPVLANTTSANP